MAHINHIRRVDHLSCLSLQDAVNLSDRNSFAAFCGFRYQRNQVGIYKMSGFCGNIGVILLHNDPQFEDQLRQVYQLRPDLAQASFKMFIANPADSCGNIRSFYDPFYGLGESAVLDALAPVRSDRPSSTEIQFLRSILSDYLSVMSYQFKKNPVPFGDYAYNLDLLFELTKMSYATLFQQVLSYLPTELSEDLSGRLSAEGAQQKAYHTVLSFSKALSSFFWTQKGFAKHSRLSIISAVKNRDLISIYIPESRSDILEYIALELQQLNHSQIPYLLLESGIDLNNCQKLKNIFLSEHSMLPYYTGILAENTSSIIRQDATNNDLSALFEQTQEMFVFSCSSVIAAQPFSDGIGNYYRRLEERHSDYHREPFHIFRSHGHGKVQREISQRTVDPEELTSLHSGCLLYGKNYPVPVLIDHFII